MCWRAFSPSPVLMWILVAACQSDPRTPFLLLLCHTLGLQESFGRHIPPAPRTVDRAQRPRLRRVSREALCE